jgi:hypothetical protein
MADSHLAGFNHHAESQNYFWTNVWTYVMCSASVGCCFFACAFSGRAQQEEEYYFQGPTIDILWRKGHSEDIDNRNKALASKEVEAAMTTKRNHRFETTKKHFNKKMFFRRL